MRRSQSSGCENVWLAASTDGSANIARASATVPGDPSSAGSTSAPTTETVVGSA